MLIIVSLNFLSYEMGTEMTFVSKKEMLGPFCIIITPLDQELS